jgi:hypothetical protein
MNPRCWSRVVLLALVVLLPATTSAQGRPFGRLLLAIGSGYDDNLFAAPASGNQQSDFVTRFGPIFEGGYQSPALTLLTHYGFDAERYFDRVELNKNLARQEALLDLNYRPGPRAALRLDGSYLDTQTPRELNVATLLPAGRARARRLRGHSGLLYDATAAVVKVAADEMAQDTIEGSLVTTTQTSRLGLSYRPTPRTTFRTDTRYSYIEFGEAETMNTVAVTGGIARVLTQSLTLELDAGPRLSLGEIRPEVAAQLRRRLRRGRCSSPLFRTPCWADQRHPVQRLMGTWGPRRGARSRSGYHRLRRAACASRRPSPGARSAAMSRCAPTPAVVRRRRPHQPTEQHGTPDVIPYRGISFKSVVTFQ